MIDALFDCCRHLRLVPDIAGQGQFFTVRVTEGRDGLIQRLGVVVNATQRGALPRQLHRTSSTYAACCASDKSNLVRKSIHAFILYSIASNSHTPAFTQPNDHIGSSVTP
jgi:hypothetical protein